MRQIKPIAYGSPEYRETLELRNRVMRIPLGLDIHREDFSCEKESSIIGAFDGEQLLGVGVMSHKDVFKVEYLCVDFHLQGTGVGGELLDRLEAMAAEQGGKVMYLDARVTAQPFYAHRGYETTSEVFIMECAPVPHVAMEKPL
nr:GNAT family N-acetyltransferase [uncultured Oscillibacter sp.]